MYGFIPIIEKVQAFLPCDFVILAKEGLVFWKHPPHAWNRYISLEEIPAADFDIFDSWLLGWYDVLPLELPSTPMLPRLPKLGSMVFVSWVAKVHFPWKAGLVLDCRYQAMEFGISDVSRELNFCKWAGFF